MTTYDDALFEAVRKKNAKTFRKLLEEYGGPNRQDNEGNTLLHCAAQYSSLGCLKILLKAGAEVTSVSRQGKTPLEIAEAKPAGKIANLLQKAIDKNTAEKRRKQAQ